ncbi:hypothetical protein DVH05_000988 [Phytophthora capsici]|nr:hypothetical protein DVH05_000988 [Phytophthora capsici]
MMLLRRLLTPLQLRVYRRTFSDASSSIVATCLRDIARSGPRVVELQLPKSNDLVCRQLMCEHVGDACACRLALVLERVPRLHALDLSNNQLRELPDAVFALERLQTLNIQRNRLTTLSNDVEKLTELESLDVSYNQLKALPVEQLETLSKLKELRIAGNGALIQAIEDQTLVMSEQLRDKIILK